MDFSFSCKGQIAPNFAVDASFTLKKGEVLGLFGPSGSGKSSILRLASGLLPNTGFALRGAKPLQKSDLGFVFQDCVVFENFTVKENLLYSTSKSVMDDLKIKLKGPKRELKILIEELLNISGLKAHENSLPSKLSGGQKQRLAFICALVNKPSVLMLDEPFSSLDELIKMQLLGFTKDLLERFCISCIVVSHNPKELLFLADQIALINGGKITKILTRSEFLTAQSPKVITQNQQGLVLEFCGEIFRLPEYLFEAIAKDLEAAKAANIAKEALEQRQEAGN